MRFGVGAPRILIVSVIGVVAMVSVVSYLISHRMTASFEEGQFGLMGQIMRSKLSEAQNKATASAELVAANPAVRQAFAARDRTELLALTSGAFRVQHEKYGISQAQFHLAPAVSFLRVHNPGRFGEDLASYRQMVVEVNRSNAIRKGIEVTTSGVGIFGTMPMTDDAGTATGSFEMAVEFGPLLDEIKNAYGLELAFFVDQKILRETGTGLASDVFSDQNRFGSLIRFRSTHPDLVRALVEDGEAGVTEDLHYLREANGVPYGVLLQPVYNYANKQIGVVAIIRDFSATRSADGQSVIWQVLLGLVASVLLIGVILVVIRGLLLRPLAVLNERVAALADGTEGRDLPGADRWCDEMRDLVDSCGRLEDKAAGRLDGDATGGGQ